MEIEMYKFLIVCPLVFIGGFIDAVAGGGGLVSLPAYILTGMPIHSCVATNKLSSFMGTTVSTVKYAKKGFIPWKIVPFCIPCALGGSAIGANIALLIPDRNFKIIMLILVPLTAIYVLTKKELFETKKAHSDIVTIVISALLAFAIGLYDGFYGPGAGAFMILLLTGVAGMELTKANGLGKAVNLSTNLAAMAVFLIHGQVLVPLGLVAGAFGIAGNYIGATHFEKKGSRIVRPILVIVLGIFFVKLISELVIH